MLQVEMPKLLAALCCFGLLVPIGAAAQPTTAGALSSLRSSQGDTGPLVWRVRVTKKLKECRKTCDAAHLACLRSGGNNGSCNPSQVFCYDKCNNQAQ